MGNTKNESPIWDGEHKIIDLANEYIGHSFEVDEGISTTMCREAFIKGASAILPKYYEERAKVANDPEQLAIALEKQGYVGTLRKEVSLLNNDYEYVRKVITLQLGKK